MYEQRYGFVLEGLSPMLMHWDNIEWSDQIDHERTRIKETDKKNFKAGDDRCPPYTWKGYTYNDGKHICLPNDNLRTGLMKAGARITLSGKKSYKELTQCAILFDDMFVTFKSNGQQIPWTAIEAISNKAPFSEHAAACVALGFKLLVKRAAVGQAKHVRVRPMFETWSVEGSFTVIDEQVTDDVIQQLWRIFGTYIGLCDWRPGSPKSPGPYGRLKATVEKM